MAVVLITTQNFCSIVDIGPDRFERRRLRERAAADLAVSAGDDHAVMMPIAPIEFGQVGQYDAFDSMRLRAVVELERAGMAFAAACHFIRGAGIGPEIMFPDSEDRFAATWTLPGGDLRRICGTAQDIARAMPKAPLVAVSINLSAVRDDIVKRAQAQLGLGIHGTNFVRGAA